MGWMSAGRVRDRVARIRQLRRERWVDYVVRKWESNQRGTGDIVKMRALHGLMRANETEVLDTSIVFAPKKAWSEKPSVTGNYRCYVCDTYHPAEAFYRDRSRSSGLSSKCKVAADMTREHRGLLPSDARRVEDTSVMEHNYARWKLVRGLSMRYRSAEVKK